METEKTTLLPQCLPQCNTKSHILIPIPVITIVCILLLANILINYPSMVDIQVPPIQQRWTKLDKDLEELRRGGNQTLEQYRRKELVRKVCQKYGNAREPPPAKKNICLFRFRGPVLRDFASRIKVDIFNSDATSLVA